jgi:hypothetical protein
VSRQTVLVVSNDLGEPERLRVCGSILRQGSRFKLYSYVLTD